MDENYEWDSEFPGDMELLETLHLGLAGPRPRPEAEPELGVRALQRGLAVHVVPVCSQSGPMPQACCSFSLGSSALAGPAGLHGASDPQTSPSPVLSSPCRCEDSRGGRPPEHGPCSGP